MKDGWKNFPAFKNQDVLGQVEAQRLGALLDRLLQETLISIEPGASGAGHRPYCCR